MKDKSFSWLEIARELQTLSQTGLAFSENKYEKMRYTRLVEIASNILAEHTTLDAEKIKNNFMHQPGYATPKIDVRSAVIKDGKILLVKEITDGKWAMPGGWADVGDKPSEVAVRETFEESGYEVKPVKVIGVFDANRTGRSLEFYHAFKIIFLCELTGGSAKTSDETSGVNFFDFENLPTLSSNRTNERHIAEIQQHIKDSYRPAFFD